MPMSEASATKARAKRVASQRRSKVAAETMADLKSVQAATPEDVVQGLDDLVEFLSSHNYQAMAQSVREHKALWLMFGAKRHRNAFKYREERRRVELEFLRHGLNQGKDVQ